MNTTEIAFCNGTFESRDLCASFPTSDDPILYEVIRVIEGIPLFLEDHLSRMHNSALSLSFIASLPDKEEISSIIAALILKNNRQTGNIQINVVLTDGKPKLYVFFIPFHYPSQDQYISGIKVDYLFAERKNPSAKIIQKNLRERADEMIKTKQLYEVLLVDRFEMVTEGSRSNLFIVSNDALYTAPLSEVLGGITRTKIIDIALSQNIPVYEKQWKYQDILTKADALFITGTSPKVLSVVQCCSRTFPPNHPIISKIATAYNQLIASYICKTKG